jgi:hypothetical protein
MTRAIVVPSSTIVGADVAANIDKFNAAYERAKDKWNSMDVRLNSYFGGQDPKAIVSAIEDINTRADRWKQRGNALAAGAPTQLASGPDTYGNWIDLGNTLIHEMQTTAEDATNDSITAAVGTTAAETMNTITSGVADLATDLHDVGGSIWKWKKPLIWVGVGLLALWVLAQLGIVATIVKVKKQITGDK